MIESKDPLTFFFLTLLLDRIRSIDLCNSFFFFFLASVRMTTCNRQTGDILSPIIKCTFTSLLRPRVRLFFFLFSPCPLIKVILITLPRFDQAARSIRFTLARNVSRANLALIFDFRKAIFPSSVSR